MWAGRDVRELNLRGRKHAHPRDRLGLRSFSSCRRRGRRAVHAQQPPRLLHRERQPGTAAVEEIGVVADFAELNHDVHQSRLRPHTREPSVSPASEQAQLFANHEMSTNLHVGFSTRRECPDNVVYRNAALDLVVELLLPRGERAGNLQPSSAKHGESIPHPSVRVRGCAAFVGS